MATSLDMIKRAMRLIQALGSGETPNDNEQTDGLAALNSMLDSWSAENLAIYHVKEESFTWASGQVSQTMGSGGDFDTARPVEIDGFSQTLNSIDYMVDKLTAAQYAAIPDKTTQSTVIQCIYPAPEFPLMILNAYPVPSVAVTLNVWSWTALQSFTTATTALAMPPGYQEAIEFNLAVMLSGEYGREPSRHVQNRAMAAKRVLKQRNNRIPSMVSEPAFMSSSRGGFDYQTGGYRI